MYYKHNSSQTLDYKNKTCYTFQKYSLIVIENYRKMSHGDIIKKIYLYINLEILQFKGKRPKGYIPCL